MIWFRVLHLFLFVLFTWVQHNFRGMASVKFHFFHLGPLETSDLITWPLRGFQVRSYLFEPTRAECWELRLKWSSLLNASFWIWLVESWAELRFVLTLLALDTYKYKKHDKMTNSRQGTDKFIKPAAIRSVFPALLIFRTQFLFCFVLFLCVHEKVIHVS